MKRIVSIIFALAICAILTGCDQGQEVEIGEAQNQLNSMLSSIDNKHIRFESNFNGNTTDLEQVIGIFGDLNSQVSYYKKLFGEDYQLGNNYIVEYNNSGSYKYTITDDSNYPRFIITKDNVADTNIEVIKQYLTDPDYVRAYEILENFDFTINDDGRYTYGEIGSELAEIEKPNVSLLNFDLKSIFGEKAKASKISIEKVDQSNNIVSADKVAITCNKSDLSSIAKAHNLDNKIFNNLKQFKLEYMSFNGTNTILIVVSNDDGVISYRYDISNAKEESENLTVLDFDTLEGNEYIGNLLIDKLTENNSMDIGEFDDTYKFIQRFFFGIDEHEDLSDIIFETHFRSIMDKNSENHLFPMSIQDLIDILNELGRHLDIEKVGEDFVLNENSYIDLEIFPEEGANNPYRIMSHIINDTNSPKSILDCTIDYVYYERLEEAETTEDDTDQTEEIDEETIETDEDEAKEGD